MNIFPASSFNELWGKGTINKHLITSNKLYKLHCFGFQSLFKVLTHISPFSLTFGWNILVTKNPLGATWGNSLGIKSLTRNIPHSYGVPSGPSMSAWISIGSSEFIIGVTWSGDFLSNSCCWRQRILIIRAFKDGWDCEYIDIKIFDAKFYNLTKLFFLFIF